jgi:hypothetical protein
MQNTYLRQETERVSDEPVVVVDWYGATNYARAE